MKTLEYQLNLCVRAHFPLQRVVATFSYIFPTRAFLMEEKFAEEEFGHFCEIPLCVNRV